MQRLFLTRAEYDSLVTRHAAWMAANWCALYRRSWSLAGVTVRAVADRIDELKGKLAS